MYDGWAGIFFKSVDRYDEDSEHNMTDRSKTAPLLERETPRTTASAEP